MSDAPSVTPRAGGFQTTVTPPRAARVPAPLDPETPDSSPPNPSSVQNNAGHGQQPRGGFGEASSETPKFEDEEDGERGDGLVTEPQHVAETPANDVATVARLALHVQQPATWAESDADDDMEEPPVWRDPDDHEVTEPVGETDDEIPEEVDEIRDDDTNQDDRPARWAFLDLRGHHALDLYNETGGLDGSSYGDTTSRQFQNGRDIQGIPWARLQYTRDRYRQKRVAEYKNYVNLDFDPATLDRLCTPVAEVSPDDEFFVFAHNTRAVRSNFVHFQLRNLVWSTSKNDAYVMSENKIVHWNSQTRRATTTLDLDGGGGGDENNTQYDSTGDFDDDMEGGVSGSGRIGERSTSDDTSDRNGNAPSASAASFSRSTNFPRVQISTTCVRDGLIAAGGFAGELVVLDVRTGVSHSTRVTQDDNGITNAVDFFTSPSGAEALVCSNNDKLVRWYDVHTMACVGKHLYPWAVNYTSVGAGGKLACVVGDTKDAWVVDTATGRLVAKCAGHLDFSFAAAWHPDGVRFATGNQDTTTRVWDIRHLGQSLAVLKGKMGAVRSLRFSRDGDFLLAAEPADFTHVYDVKSNFTRRQTLDHFGETAGVSFSPCAETLFVGVADLTYGSVLEFERKGLGGGGGE